MKRANGDGSIIKLSGKRRRPYAVRITVGWSPEGKQILKYLGYYASKTEAKAALREYLVNPFDLSGNKTTLKEVYNIWEKTATLSETTMKNYASAFRKCEMLYDKPIRDIKVSQIELILKDATTSTQPMIRNVLNQVYIAAEKNDIIEKNIIPLLQVEKHVAGRDKKPFNEDQIKTLLEYNDHHYADTLNILLYTGLRIKELLEIRNENVFIKERYMIGGKKTAAGKNRIIHIHDEILDIIEKWHEQGNEYLIGSPRGGMVDYENYNNKFWKMLRGIFNFSQTPHDCRHTFVTNCTKQGVERVALQKIIGHKGQDITDHYTHRTKEELLEEINKLKY